MKNKIKINLGSGPTGAAGWENLDWGLLPLMGKYKINKLLSKAGILDKGYGVDWPKIRLSDIKRRLPYENDSVDYIYCSHVLEHFLPAETAKILKECQRVLKKNGVARFVLPDLDKLIKNYQDADEFNNEMFGYEKKSYGSLIGKIKEKFIRPHQWMFNKKGFRKILKESGFEKIKFRKYGQGKSPDIKKLDLPEYRSLSFFVEVKK